MINPLIIADIIIGLSLWALFGAILINFILSKSNSKETVKKEKKSIVETGSMIGFFLFFYILIRFNVGYYELKDSNISLGLIITGTIMVVLGCILNIMGRFNLGSNWGNQVIIYKDHSLVKSGLYGLVRHPLYASLMLMFYGGALVHTNYLAFLSNTFIFIPFMYYRASQEEAELRKVFKEYIEYQKDVGMFFPKLR